MLVIDRVTSILATLSLFAEAFHMQLETEDFQPRRLQSPSAAGACQTMMVLQQSLQPRHRNQCHLGCLLSQVHLIQEPPVQQLLVPALPTLTCCNQYTS